MPHYLIHVRLGRWMQYINHIKTLVDKINNSSPLQAAIFPQLAFALVAVEVV